MLKQEIRRVHNYAVLYLVNPFTLLKLKEHYFINSSNNYLWETYQHQLYIVHVHDVIYPYLRSYTNINTTPFTQTECSASASASFQAARKGRKTESRPS